LILQYIKMARLKCSICQHNLDPTAFSKVQKNKDEGRVCTKCVLSRASAKQKKPETPSPAKQDSNEEDDDEEDDDDDDKPVDATKAFIAYKDSLFPPTFSVKYFRYVKYMDDKLCKKVK
jgi:hypothetical protein